MTTYTLEKTGAEVDAALGKAHDQNTDTGTTSTTFHIDSGNTGPKLKQDSGTLHVRNSADDADAAVKAATFKTGTYTLTVDETKSVSDKAEKVVYKTISAPAGAFTPVTTNGAETGTNEYATNDINLDYFAFDATTLEKVQFAFSMPEDWDRSTIKAKFQWSSASGSTTADTVEWGLKAGALSDSDAIDAALGTGQVISDALLADDGADLQLSGATPAITVGGTPALGDLIVFEAYRNVSGTDDLTEDAWLFEVIIQYQTGSTAVAGW
jgi:hypothetical protein